MRDSNVAIASHSVLETTHQPAGLFLSTTLFCTRANFLHEKCTAGLVKHLSPLYKRTPQLSYKTHSCYSELNNYVQNLYFGFFNILKTNRIMPFCNLFMERPSYIDYTGHWMAIITVGLDRIEQGLTPIRHILGHFGDSGVTAASASIVLAVRAHSLCGVE